MEQQCLVLPDLSLIPQTSGDQNVEHQNIAIMEHYFQQKLKRGYKRLDILNVMERNLKNYKRVKELAYSLKLDQILQYEQFLMPVMTEKLKQQLKYQKRIFLNDLELIPLNQGEELNGFNEQINKEMIMEYFDIELKKEEIKEVKEQVKQKEIVEEGYFKGFLKLVKLKQIPNNQYFASLGYLIDNNRKSDKGYYKQNQDYQSFKQFCRLNNQLFEINQFKEHLESIKDRNQNRLMIDKLYQTFKCKSNIPLESEIKKEIVNTKINNRELRELLYKMLYCKVSEQLVVSERGDYIQQHNEKSRNYEWFDQLINMLQRLKGNREYRNKQVFLRVCKNILWIENESVWDILNQNRFNFSTYLNIFINLLKMISQQDVSLRKNSSMTYQEYVNTFNRVPRKPVITPKEGSNVSPLKLLEESNSAERTINLQKIDKKYQSDQKIDEIFESEADNLSRRIIEINPILISMNKDDGEMRQRSQSDTLNYSCLSFLDRKTSINQK